MRGPWAGDLNINTGWRYSSGNPHFSWDVACPMGTSLYAIGDGIIVDCHDGVKDQPPGIPAGSGAPSNWIILKFTAPKDSRYAGQTLYAYYQHLKKGGVLVKIGQRVKQGELIALSGNSGNTTGPHLHLTILKPGFQMSAVTRYAYLGNSSMVVWEPRLAWKATKYGIRYEVYVSKLRLGVDNSSSVRTYRKALIVRELLQPAEGLSVDKPGNKFTSACLEATKIWQRKRGYAPDGTLSFKQAQQFFKNNEHVKVFR